MRVCVFQNGMKHVVIAAAHWAVYTFFIVPIILNAEIWFFGTKFNGAEAVAIHLLIGGAGIAVGCFIYKKRKHSLWVGLGMAALLFADVLVNHLTA